LGLKDKQCLKNLGENIGGPSGDSSSFSASKELRGFLADIFQNKTMNIHSFFDAACGDWVFMQHVDLSKITYIGGDVSEFTVKENNRCFRKPNVNFVQYDLFCHRPPSVDLMLMRDVLFHFQDDIVLKILQTIMESNVKYLLTTTFLTPNDQHSWNRHRAYGETDVKRAENTTIGFRELNLMDKPFCLPPPILKVVDSHNLYAKDGQPDRYVGLWKLPLVVGDCSHFNSN
jgi:hypothetical protein